MTRVPPSFDILVVAFAAHRGASPRGARTRAIVRALETRGASVRLIAPPATETNGDRGATAASGRKTASPAQWLVERGKRAAAAVLVDKHEPRARREAARLPDARGALLIGAPFSPIAYAARTLTRSGTPYVVDVGDPWVLTARPEDAPSRIAGRRARTLERHLWDGATAGIVTTFPQADALHRDVRADLPLLVRPNGYGDKFRDLSGRYGTPARRDGVLRLAHFGMISSPRLDVSTVLRKLAAAGRWHRVELHQYGPVWNDQLDGLPEPIEVVRHTVLPWEQVVRLAPTFDAVVVVGNHNSAQMPSKAVEYMTLPTPRLAVVNGQADDALTRYLDGRPGWLVAPHDASDLPARLDAFVRARIDGELAPPLSEGWTAVSEQLVTFVLDQLSRGTE